MAKKCNKCGFLNNPDDSHYCGKCGGVQIGEWEIYDASRYKAVERDVFLKSEKERNKLKREIEALRADIVEVKRKSEIDISGINHELEKLRWKHQNLSHNLGNRLVKAYDRHVDYLCNHPLAYHVEGILLTILVVSLPLLVAEMKYLFK